MMMTMMILLQGFGQEADVASGIQRFAGKSRLKMTITSISLHHLVVSHPQLMEYILQEEPPIPSGWWSMMLPVSRAPYHWERLAYAHLVIETYTKMDRSTHLGFVSV